MDFSQWGNPSKEWLAFAAANPALLARSDDHLPPLVLQQKTNHSRTTIAKTLVATTGLGNLVTTEDYVVSTRDGKSITVRSYRPILLGSKPLPGYVFFHGGGFFFGALDTELFNCSWLAHALSMTVVHVCYRHTPHVSGLTPWHDALDGFEWVATHTEKLGIDPSRIVVGGISAGGSLTACVVQNEVRRARETGTPCRVQGQVLGIPNLINVNAFPYHLFTDKEKTSPEQCADAAVIPRQRMKLFTDMLGSEVDPSDPTWSPGLVDEEELRGTPHTAVLVSGWDPIRDEGLWYAQKLKNAGVRTKVHIFPGLPHAFYAFVGLPSHRHWNEIMLDSLRWAVAEEDGWIVEEPPVMSPLMEKALSIGAPVDPTTPGATPADMAKSGNLLRGE
ncbi:alpha/beta-hydrolase [Daldinia vernicosa]|uniref:alpha/beta-hydrolase n=1 Tax=Daldinia vernicosa TaxID=114800 RepID=UPI002007885D|nr:alpha/beta-hydrolase [Daldinia vernicosa]KAI0844427.1 alpha/beta-hydrolase [Daldinia vernicosa]